MKVSELVQASLQLVHDSPVECLGGVLKLICNAAGADYGLILTADPAKHALLVDVLEGYADETTMAYRSERIKLTVDESQSVSALALAEANRNGKPTVVIRSGEDPINFELVPVAETVACAVNSLGDFVSVLVLERKTTSSHETFAGSRELENLVLTSVQLVSIALAARQSFVFKFDEFVKQANFIDFDHFSCAVARWVFERFRVSLCSLYFTEYDPNTGKEFLVCKQRVVRDSVGTDAGPKKLAFGEDYAGWIAANNSSLITFADSRQVLHITSGNITSEVSRLTDSKLVELYPAIHFKSYLGVAITDGKHLVGVLEVVDSEREYSFSDEELLEMITDRIGSEYARISIDLRREALFDIPNIETRDLRLVIRGVVDAAMKVAAATHGLFMFKDGNAEFQPRGVRGYGLKKDAIAPVKVGSEDLTNWVMGPNKPAFMCSDLTNNHELDPDTRNHIKNTLAPTGFIPKSVRSLLMVPVYMKDATTNETDDLGVLVLMSLRPNAFQRDEVVITALAEIVSYHIWANKKTAELESTSEKVNQLEQALPLYNRAATAAAASAGTVHTAKKHVNQLKELIKKLGEHPKVKQERELIEAARIIAKQFAELADLYDKLHGVFRGGKPTFESCDLSELVHDVRSYMDPKFRDRHVTFRSLVKQANLPKVQVDPVLIKVVFINLINNSIEANAREIVVSAKKTSMITAGIQEDAIEMNFKDNGKGIQPEFVDKIFDFFFTEGKKDGTGLGLLVNRNIMDNHRGTIRVASTSPGQGTVFSLLWPLALP